MKNVKTLTKQLVAAAGLSLVTAAAMAAEITVSAAASLTNAFKDIATLYHAENPDTRVNFNFAASGVLLQQISQGAPVDVFASADQVTLDRGEQQGLIDTATRKDFATNSLVLIQPRERATTLYTLDDLEGPNVRRIALGKPGTVPVGRYTEQALESAQLWKVLQPRYIHAESVRQVLDYVARGEVDAGFVYKTDAILMKDDVDIVLTAAGHDPVSYPVAVVSDSDNANAAQAFVDFLLSSQAQQILSRYGFGQP